MDTVKKAAKGLVLVVEDNQPFRRLLMKTLELNGFETREAENGLVGKTVFDLNQDRLSVIVSDIRMPEMDGVQLLSHVRQTSKAPFILMTGFSEILEVKGAYKLGANAFLPKPFNEGALLSAIDSCLHPRVEKAGDPKADTENAPRYCAIHIDEFLTTSKLRTDIYVKIAEGKFVKVAHKGEAVPIDRLRIYKEKEVDYLYMTAQDFADYVDFSTKLTSLAADSKGLKRETKARLLRSATETILQKCFLSDMDKDVLAPARHMVEESMALMMEVPHVLDIFLALERHSNRIFAQGVCVAVYSCIVARKCGWSSANTQFRISVASLLHDIGLKELPAELIRKNRADWTAKEVADFESHPTRGRDILLQMRGIPEDIAQIVCQHHENPSGTGYPYHKHTSEIHPLALLIGTVSRFVELVMPFSEDTLAMDPIEALNHIRHSQQGPADRAFLQNLAELFRHREMTALKNA